MPEANANVVEQLPRSRSAQELQLMMQLKKMLDPGNISTRIKYLLQTKWLRRDSN